MAYNDNYKNNRYNNGDDRDRYRNNKHRNNYKRPYGNEFENRYGERNNELRYKRDYIDEDDRMRTSNNDKFYSIKKFKKQNVRIEDMNGDIYIIDGNFSTDFVAGLVQYIDAAREYKSLVKNSDADTITKKMPDLLQLLKEWCLKLINMNVEGKTYTMETVNRGFNDIKALIYLLSLIVDEVQRFAKENEVKSKLDVSNVATIG